MPTKIRVGLLTDPEGKGIGSCSRWTPSYTALYVMVGDFRHHHHHHPRKQRRCSGPDASLCPSEVVTFASFSRFGSERDFYRYAKSNLRDAFPALPDRSQFNRLVRSQAGLIEEVALHLAATVMGTESCSYQALDCSAAACPSLHTASGTCQTRTSNRSSTSTTAARGRHGRGTHQAHLGRYWDRVRWPPQALRENLFMLPEADTARRRELRWGASSLMQEYADQAEECLNNYDLNS